MLPEEFSMRGRKVWVAGETGLVGQAVVKRLASEDVRILSASHAVLDLTNQRHTCEWIQEHKPEVVVLAAAKVGGIGANAAYSADFLSVNLAIAQNVIEGSYRAGVQKLLFLGSSCIYPKYAVQPIKEGSLLSGTLEPTNEAYAIAKIAGLKLCQFYRQQYGSDFISAMPTNLYGQGDKYDEHNSHVIPALILKIHTAKERGNDCVEIWGSGRPLREFLYIDDLADALIYLLKYYSEDSPINVGSGEELTIADLAGLIKEVVGFQGDLIFNADKPDGTPRKFLDSSRIMSLGWRPMKSLRDGLALTYQDFLRVAAPQTVSERLRA